MSRGWCPFARQHRGLAAGPFGYPAGAAGQNRPLLFIDHRMAGYKRTLDNDAWRHDNWVGVHAGIGRDGSLDQYTSIFDASWGNGVAGSVTRYDRSNSRLAALESLGGWVPVTYAGTRAYALVARGVNVLNAHTISTEHEDEGRDQPWTPAMLRVDIDWKEWCLEEVARADMAMERGTEMLAGHFQIDAVNRPDCPGDNWPRAEILRALMEEADEMWKRINGVAKWWTGMVLKAGPRGTMQLDKDFPTMPPAKAVDLDVYLASDTKGGLAFYDGNGSFAGKVTPRSPHEVIRVVPGWTRQVLFEVEGPSAHVETMGVVGYVA